MKTATQIGAVMLVFLAGFAVRAAEGPAETMRVRLIVGQTEEKTYQPRLKAIHSLETEAPLSDEERASLLAFLRRTDGTEGTDEMELAALNGGNGVII